MDYINYICKEILDNKITAYNLRKHARDAEAQVLQSSLEATVNAHSNAEPAIWYVATTAANNAIDTLPKWDAT